MRETVGAESIELTRYLAKREAKERQEEELFTRAPVTRREKNLEKHMTKSRNGYESSCDILKYKIWPNYRKICFFFLKKNKFKLYITFFGSDNHIFCVI